MGKEKLCINCQKKKQQKVQRYGTLRPQSLHSDRETPEVLWNLAFVASFKKIAIIGTFICSSCIHFRIAIITVTTIAAVSIAL